MGTWNELLDEIKNTGSTYDYIRRKYLKELHEMTGRNVIVYYSGWLQKPNVVGTSINDNDKNGLMTTIKGLDRSKGLDLFLHTPGGETAATESIVTYLRAMFGNNIRAVVPQIAMSSGTMIACSAKSILMGKHSSLGPIDPQYRGLPAHGVIEEFKQAYEEIKEDPLKAHLWQPIIAKYNPTLIGECQKSIDWSEKIVKQWLCEGMFQSLEDAEDRAKGVLNELGDHSLTLSHARHLSPEKCREIGLEIEILEENQELQEAVLTVHHSCIHTLSATPAYKIIENHVGEAFIQTAQFVAVKQ